MKAKFAGKCGYCKQHFSAGAEIEKQGTKWCIVNCEGCAKKRRRIELINGLEERMLNKHNILCGYDFLQQGRTETGTRMEFIRKAESIGEATQEEIDAWMSFYSGWSLMKSLAD